MEKKNDCETIQKKVRSFNEAPWLLKATIIPVHLAEKSGYQIGYFPNVNHKPSSNNFLGTC